MRKLLYMLLALTSLIGGLGAGMAPAQADTGAYSSLPTTGWCGWEQKGDNTTSHNGTHTISGISRRAQYDIRAYCFNNTKPKSTILVKIYAEDTTNDNGSFNRGPYPVSVSQLKTYVYIKDLALTPGHKYNLYLKEFDRIIWDSKVQDRWYDVGDVTARRASS
jgi:hypothetical protein